MRLSSTYVRFSLLFAIALGTWPSLALAKPTVAVAPLDGDSDGKIDAIVSDAATAEAKVTSTKAVAKAIKELGISNPDTSKAAKKLRKRLEVDAVIYGKLERDGKKKKLTISVYTRGKKPERFEIEYTKSSSKSFREDLREELATRLAPDEAVKDDDTEPASDEDANVRVHKHVRTRKDVDTERDIVTQGAAFADLGIGGVHRSLTYVANTGENRPPPVGTGAYALQLDGEIYPGAFNSLDGIAAAFGIYGSVNKVLGLSITIPGTTQSAAISETSYAVGVRYRYIFGHSSLAVGLSYWGQSFTADRSKLTTPTELNMPDTEYQAIAPGALLRVGLHPIVGLTLQVDVPLMLKSGPITDASYFGTASVVAVAVQLGLDVALGRHYGLHFAGFFDQESLSFKAGMLSSATDRTAGGSVAFSLMY